MKDFIKIFLFLLSVVVAFVFGRNYGEQTVKESAEFKENKDAQARLEQSEKELQQTKEKIQNILNSVDLKKADEVYTQVMTLFLVDLGMYLSNEKQKDLDASKLTLKQCLSQPKQETTKTEPKTQTHQEEKPKAKNTIKKIEKKWTDISYDRFKSKEWLLQNSNSENALKRAFEDLKLKRLDLFLEGAQPVNAQELNQYLGSYRGKITDLFGKDYGSLVIEIKLADAGLAVGQVRVLKNGNIETANDFKSNNFGYKRNDFDALVFNVGDRYFQVYKSQQNEKLIGYFYQRMPNGATSTIGQFVLSRTDKF